MSHDVLSDLYNAAGSKSNLVPDPGAGGTIVLANKSLAVCEVGSGTRYMPKSAPLGAVLFIKSDAGTTLLDSNGGAVATVTGIQGFASDGDEGWQSFDSYSVVNPLAFGATGDGTTDDSAAIQAAINTGKNVCIPSGTYVVNTTLSLDNIGQRLFGDGIGRTVLRNTTELADAVLSIRADYCHVSDLTIEEHNALPTTAGSNYGIQYKGSHCVVERVRVSGFDAPVSIKSTAELFYDNNTLRDAEVTNGYGWGVEVDSSQNATIENVVSHSHGTDGFKVLCSVARTCEGYKAIGCEAYNNGLRDTEAGGSETWNGNGIDVYDGGYKFTLIGLHCHDNYGSGFNIKGDASDANVPRMGEGALIGCHAHANKATATQSCHGFEFNVGGNTSGSVITLTNCHASGNSGFGLSLLGGYSHSIIGGSFTGNGVGGVRVHETFDTTIIGAAVLGNTGNGIQVGTTSDASFSSLRTKIRDCVVSGLYDTDLATLNDPRASAGSKVTTSGIRIYSDSADVLIDGCEFRDTTTHGVYSLGNRVTLANSTFYDCPGGVIRAGAGSLNVRDVLLQETDYTVNASLAGLYVENATVVADRMTFIQSSASSGRVIRLNHASADLTLGTYSATNFNDTTVLHSSGTLRAGDARTNTAVSAAADPGTSIVATAKYVTITSSNADHVVILPTAVVGKVINGYVGANGCEFYASGSSININGVVCSATNEAAMPANSLWKAECVGASDWILTYVTSAGAAGATITPDGR